MVRFMIMNSGEVLYLVVKRVTDPLLRFLGGYFL